MCSEHCQLPLKNLYMPNECTKTGRQKALPAVFLSFISMCFCFCFCFLGKKYHFAGKTCNFKEFKTLPSVSQHLRFWDTLFHPCFYLSVFIYPSIRISQSIKTQRDKLTWIWKHFSTDLVSALPGGSQPIHQAVFERKTGLGAPTTPQQPRQEAKEIHLARWSP